MPVCPLGGMIAKCLIAQKKKFLSLIFAATSPPPSTMPPSATTTDMLEMPESLFGTLKAWEFGLIIGIASLIIIVILLSGAVWMGHMTVKRRRANRQQRRVQYKKHNNLRPKSMAQEIQMMDAESIDLGG